MQAWNQIYTPLGSLWLSSLAAAIPIIFFFVALAGPMALRGGGLVVHISSDAAVSAYPGWGAYGVSKAALDHLARIWAVELEEAGVRFVAFDPGEMNTRMHADAMPDADPAELADPAHVARRIVDALASAGSSTGGRVIASEQEAAS